MADILTNVLVVTNSTLISEIFPQNLVNREKEGLQIVFRLFSRLESGVDVLRNSYEKFVAACGLEFVNSVDYEDASFEPQTLFKPILEQHAHFSDLNMVCFSSDTGFVASMDKVFSEDLFAGLSRIYQQK